SEGLPSETAPKAQFRQWKKEKRRSLELLLFNFMRCRKWERRTHKRCLVYVKVTLNSKDAKVMAGTGATHNIIDCEREVGPQTDKGYEQDAAQSIVGIARTSW
ncbi:hypothetical protein AMTR_s00143p00108540, partial [Amborella trichopoda]